MVDRDAPWSISVRLNAWLSQLGNLKWSFILEIRLTFCIWEHSRSLTAILIVVKLLLDFWRSAQKMQLNVEFIHLESISYFFEKSFDVEVVINDRNLLFRQLYIEFDHICALLSVTDEERHPNHANEKVCFENVLVHSCTSH